MILTLKAVSLNDQPLSPSIVARFDAGGGTIGRADHNTLALPDPERHISRLQAEIVLRGDAFMVRNVGAANPVLVGTRALMQGEDCDLAQGDVMRIGGYALLVDYRSQADPSEVTRGLSAGLRTGNGTETPWPAGPPSVVGPARGATTAPGMAAAPQANPFADLLGGAGIGGGAAGGNPFADLLSPAAPPPPALPPVPPAPPAWGAPQPRPAAPVAADPFADLLPGPAGVQPASAALAPAPQPRPANRLPADFDPFASPPRAPAPAPVSYASPPSPLDDLGLVGRRPSIDQAFGLGDSGSGDPLARFMADAPAPAPAPGADGRTRPSDPLALFGAPPPPAPAGPAQSDHLPAVHAAMLLPTAMPAPAVAAPAMAEAQAPAASPAQPAPLPPPPPPAPSSPPPPTPQPAPMPAPQVVAPQPAPASADSAAVESALWAAFCDGAGVDLPLPPGGGEARMRMLGQILHSAVGGTLQLMAVRTSTKHELRAALTVIQPRNNNPLKFSPDAKSGVEQLVQPAARGFLAGPAAMDDAMHDLVGHAVGTVAGMRAAIEGMLDRFDPAALEAKLSKGSVLESLLPGSRRARLWDLYVQHHQNIREEAEEDFHTLFGKAFLAAYQQQVDRLKDGAPPP